MNAFLNTLLGLTIREVLSDDSGDLSRFGIGEGVNEISFYAEGKERHQTLRIGQATQDSVIAEFTRGTPSSACLRDNQAAERDDRALRATTGFSR